MKKHLVAIFIPILVLALGFPGAALASHDDYDGDDYGYRDSSNSYDDYDDDYYRDRDRTRSNDIIAQGLCVGASLDLSARSEALCARGIQPGFEDPHYRQDGTYEHRYQDSQRDHYPHYDRHHHHDHKHDYDRQHDGHKDKYRHSDRYSRDDRYREKYDAYHDTYTKKQRDVHHDGYRVDSTDTYKDRYHADKYKAPRDDRQPNRHEQRPAPPERRTPPAPPERPERPAPEPEPAPEPQPSRVEYAALGNSVAAGLGLGSVTDDERCGRTSAAYPYAVADSRGLDVTHIACSGATMGDLITRQGVSGPNLPPQLDAAFAGGTPDLITITAGANDTRWDYFLRKCYSGTCGTETDQRIASGLLAALDVKMRLALRSIEQRSDGTPPEVTVTGYYNPLSDRCSEVEPRITPEEIAWLGNQTAAINRTLQNVSADYGFVRFAPVDFTGHDLCSDDPWIQGFNDSAPFHPTAEGQRIIAQSIM